MTFSRELGRNRKILSKGREKEGVEKAALVRKRSRKRHSADIFRMLTNILVFI